MKQRLLVWVFSEQNYLCIEGHHLFLNCLLFLQPSAFSVYETKSLTLLFWKYIFPKTSFLYPSPFKIVFPFEKGIDYPLFHSNFLGIDFSHFRNIKVKLAFHYPGLSFLCIITLIFISSHMLVVNNYFFQFNFFWSSPSFHWDQHFQKNSEGCYKLLSIYLCSV